MKWEYRVVTGGAGASHVEEQINKLAAAGFELASHAMAASAAGETNVSVIMRRQVWEGLVAKREEEGAPPHAERAAKREGTWLPPSE